MQTFRNSDQPDSGDVRSIPGYDQLTEEQRGKIHDTYRDAYEGNQRLGLRVALGIAYEAAKASMASLVEGDEVQDHTKNPYHKILTKHGYQHTGSSKYQFSTYKQDIDKHSYKHPEFGDTVDVGINHNRRDDSHPPKMWSHYPKDFEPGFGSTSRRARGRKASDLDNYLTTRHAGKGAKVTEAEESPFDKLKGKLSNEKGVTNPAGLAAAIGRKKYGKENFDDAAKHGERLGESESESHQDPSHKRSGFHGLLTNQGYKYVDTRQGAHAKTHNYTHPEKGTAHTIHHEGGHSAWHLRKHGDGDVDWMNGHSKKTLNQWLQYQDGRSKNESPEEIMKRPGMMDEAETDNIPQAHFPQAHPQDPEKGDYDDAIIHATDRYLDLKAKKEGDWGNADTKYAPGPTYEEEGDDEKDEGDWGDADTKYAPGPTYEDERNDGSKKDEGDWGDADIEYAAGVTYEDDSESVQKKNADSKHAADPKPSNQWGTSPAQPPSYESGGDWGNGAKDLQHTNHLSKGMAEDAVGAYYVHSVGENHVIQQHGNEEFIVGPYMNKALADSYAADLNQARPMTEEEIALDEKRQTRKSKQPKNPTWRNWKADVRMPWPKNHNRLDPSKLHARSSIAGFSEAEDEAEDEALPPNSMEEAMMQEADGSHELFYGSGGHGGPYPSYEAAKQRAAKLLRGSSSENTIHIMPRTKDGVGGYGRKVGTVSKNRDGEIHHQRYSSDTTSDFPVGNKEKMSEEEIHEEHERISPGDRVTIRIHAGIGRNGPEYKEATGRAVMRGPAGWVLNMGGPHGRPAIASSENIVKVFKAKSKKQDGAGGALIRSLSQHHEEVDPTLEAAVDYLTKRGEAAVDGNILFEEAFELLEWPKAQGVNEPLAHELYNHALKKHFEAVRDGHAGGGNLNQWADNYRKKQKRGVYDPEKAVKGLTHAISRTEHEYFGVKPGDKKPVVSSATRHAAAAKLLPHIHTLMAGKKIGEK